MSTAAEREIAHLARNYPCPEPLDRADAIFSMHPAKTLAQLAMQLHGARLLVAEVGSTAPNAYTKYFYDDSRLVQLNSGLIDFVNAVTATLFGNTTMFIGNALPVAPRLSPEDAASRLAVLYDAWRSGALWREERLRTEPLDLSKEAANGAELLSDAALLFILSHELGHAALHAAALRCAAGAPVLTAAQELEADAFGLKIVMLGWGEAGRKNWRMGAAGAMIALRIFSALARLGHIFPGAHPPPEVRLAQLRQILHELCGSDEAYYHITTVAIGYEEQMEAAENILLGRSPDPEDTAERIVSVLCVILEEAEKGVDSATADLAALTARIKSVDADVLKEAGVIAGQILSPRSPWYGQSAKRRAMVTRLDRVLPSLPAAFSGAYVNQWSFGPLAAVGSK